MAGKLPVAVEMSDAQENWERDLDGGGGGGTRLGDGVEEEWETTRTRERE